MHLSISFYETSAAVKIRSTELLEAFFGFSAGLGTQANATNVKFPHYTYRRLAELSY